MTHSIGILGTGSAVPEHVLTNAQLATMVNTDPEWITTRTGIRERHIADEQTASSDLAIVAAGISPEELGLIICATVTPDTMFPATACLVQDRIGACNAGAFDLSAGCSGFLYGLSCAVSMLQTGLSRYALVIGVDTLSKITDFTDRTTCVLFADGAGAVVLGPVEDQGNYPQAAALLTEGLALCQALGDKERIAECLEGLAGLAGVQGQAERAAQLFGAAAALRDAIGAPLPPAERIDYDCTIDTLRAEPDTDAFAEAWRPGGRCRWSRWPPRRSVAGGTRRTEPRSTVRRRKGIRGGIRNDSPLIPIHVVFLPVQAQG